MKIGMLLALASTFVAGSVNAVQVIPVSYDMPNGASGLYTYWDDAYSGLGCKTCDSVTLTSGLGDLTDGIIATQSWNVTEAPAGPGPYVGWVDINPTITFHFGQSVSISSVTLYLDDSQVGGVLAPLSVTIGSQTYPITDPPGTAPFAFTISNLGFVGSNLALTINRNDRWSFASEIQFLSPVPEPSVGQMLAIGLLTVVVVARRRRMMA